jgi:hypothetical protein
MSFLEELENKKEDSGKTSKELWESCFKYFKHFVSILQKDDDEFAIEFQFVFLNLTRKCLLTGPYEISRMQNNNDLTLEIKMYTQVIEPIKIKRKDKRSAELLKIKLNKEHINSVVKRNSKGNYFIEINGNINSNFKLTLKKGTDFILEYINVCTTTPRSIQLPIDKIDQANMDKIAQYLVGQNQSLYTETISDEEISKLREKIELEKKLKAQREADIQAKIAEEIKQEELRKANTLQQRSKRYLLNQVDKYKKKIIAKVDDILS